MPTRPRINLPLTLAALLAFFLNGCRTLNHYELKDASEAGRTYVLDRFEEKIEKRFSDEEKDTVLGDLAAFTDLKLEFPSRSEGIGRSFGQVFGGYTSADVLDFLDERIYHLYPPSADLQVSFRAEGDQEAPIQAEAPTPEHETDGASLAANYGAAIWFNSLMRPGMQVSVLFNDEPLTIHSSRVGIVKVQPRYFSSELGSHKRSLVSRLSTLVHEARHSDCTGGLNPSDVERIRTGRAPLNLACTYPHVACPRIMTLPDGTEKPHPYAGLRSCDGMIWGPYMIQSLFALAIARACPTCEQEQIQEAQMLVIDRLMRLGEYSERLKNGTMPAPEMGSRGLIEAE